MRRFTKNSTLYDFAPGLVKEWHPSANGKLTPRIVEIAYPKKVWWICSQSHEWQATIKTRVNGSKCPLCVQNDKPANLRDNPKISNTQTYHTKNLESFQTPFAAFESDPPDGNLGHDFRKSRRFNIRATAVLENPNSGHWFYAAAKNFSANGMCFEAEGPVKPGTMVIIKLDRPLFTSNRQTYDSIIRWCKILDTENKAVSGYGIGAEFI
jgi:hypothetical protein